MFVFMFIAALECHFKWQPQLPLLTLCSCIFFCFICMFVFVLVCSQTLYDQMNVRHMYVCMFSLFMRVCTSMIGCFYKAAFFTHSVQKSDSPQYLNFFRLYGVFFLRLSFIIKFFYRF